MPASELDVQMARSRNDLDAGVFRMLLRGQLLDVLDRVLTTGRTALDAADRYADVVITGYTHRRAGPGPPPSGTPWPVTPRRWPVRPPRTPT